MQEMKARAAEKKNEPKIKLNQKGDAILDGAALPLKTRLQYKHLRGSGLFLKHQAWAYLKEKVKSKDEMSWWTWTPVKLANNQINSYGEFTCRACSSSMMHLRSIKNHLNSINHQNEVAKIQKRLENNIQPTLYLQNRIEMFITSQRKISLDEKQHRIDAVRAAATANIQRFRVPSILNNKNESICFFYFFSREMNEVRNLISVYSAST